MTTKESLGKLERVALRDCWDREDSDFTPWLAGETNIRILGESIGMELEVQEEEAAVGLFRADILCRDTSTDELVIVENQLERTDHSHLGQVITYAAGFEAVTVVWIAAKFTEEHRAALDWLNRITEEHIRFFGIEIELWRIGDSNPAPMFHIAAKPNDWAKNVKVATRRGGTTEGGQSQVTFWTAFGNYLQSQNASFKPPSPYPRNWNNWGIGRTGSALVAKVLQGKSVSVRVQFNNHLHPTWFNKTLLVREDIERELGFALVWDERPNKLHCFMLIEKSYDTRNEDELSKAFAWILEHMDILNKVFRPHIMQLDDSPLK
jgi:hypothetical protein